METHSHEQQQYNRLRASMGGYACVAKHGGQKMTQRAREGFYARFERQVDPHGLLDPRERAIRAQAAMSAYMRGLALARAGKRRARQA